MQNIIFNLLHYLLPILNNKLQTVVKQIFTLIVRGEKGIRTLDSVSAIHTFQACLFNHSSISPKKAAKIQFPFQALNIFSAFDVVTRSTSSILIFFSIARFSAIYFK